jgi:hypothetical protein
LSVQSEGVVLTVTSYGTSPTCISAVTVYFFEVTVRNVGARSVLNDTIVVGDSGWKATSMSSRAIRIERSTLPIVRVARGEHVEGRISFVAGGEAISRVTWDDSAFSGAVLSFSPPAPPRC